MMGVGISTGGRGSELVSPDTYYDQLGLYKDLDESLDDIRDAIASIGILSLSCLADNILMWSHYAANHQGLVYEFEVSPGEAPFEEVVDVRYDDCVHSVSDKNAVDLIRVKSPHWAYEQDMRVLKRHFGLYSFTPCRLKRVILGCEMPIENRLRLRDMVAKSESRPELWQAEKDYQGFKLILRPVEDRDFGIVTIVTRPERSDDAESVERVLRRGDRTSGLVNDLRHFGYTRESVVAEANGYIIGFITCSILEIRSVTECRQTLLLHPPAVLPKHESVEMDAKLIDAIISICRSNRWDSLLTFGDPGFYQRFGFSGELANAIDPRWNGPAFLGMEFCQGALRGVKGTIVFPPPWGFD